MSTSHAVPHRAADPILTSTPEIQKHIHYQLIILLHALDCNREAHGRACIVPHCGVMKKVIQHLESCKLGYSCNVDHCYSSRRIISHWEVCEKIDCPTCYVVNLPMNQWPDYAGQRRADDTDEDEDEEDEDEEDEEAEKKLLEGKSATFKRAYAIYKRQNTVESLITARFILRAESFLKINDYAAAIYCYQKCLDFQEQYLDSDDRFLCDIYYEMGLAHFSAKQYPEALKNFRTGQSILNLRLENLKNAPGSSASYKKDAEVSDLENILLDIEEKNKFTEDLIQNTKEGTREIFDSVS